MNMDSKLMTYDNITEEEDANGGTPRIYTLPVVDKFTAGNQYPVFDENEGYCRTIDDAGEERQISLKYFKSENALPFSAKSYADVPDLRKRKMWAPVEQEVKDEIMKDFDRVNQYKATYPSPAQTPLYQTLESNFLAGVMGSHDMKCLNKCSKTPLEDQLLAMRTKCLEMAHELDGMATMINVLSTYAPRR